MYNCQFTEYHVTRYLLQTDIIDKTVNFKQFICVNEFCLFLSEILDTSNLLEESVVLTNFIWIVSLFLCIDFRDAFYHVCARAAEVHLNFRAGSTIPVPVCTVPSSMNRTSRCNKVDAVRLYASYRLNLLLLKGQRGACAKWPIKGAITGFPLIL